LATRKLNTSNPETDKAGSRIPLKIDTTNEQSLFYANDILKLTVLGGIKLEGLDRMRVTLKVELKDSSRPPVRHNLDLYNDNQLEKFIRKIAERLEIGTSVIAASLSELTEQLEKYRLDEIKAQQNTVNQIKHLTEKEKEAAKENLSTENLLEQTTTDLQNTGIQGEEYNALILLLAMTSRKMRDPLSVICLARSGVGKSYLMEKVAECIPPEEAKEHTQFSGNSFYYFKREEIKGTVFLIEDLDGAQAVMFPIRELQTKKRISKTVTIKDKNGQMRTITLIVEGPVSVIGCTTKEKIYEDNANRAILIYLDGSKQQDERIMNYQKNLRANLINTYAEKLLQEKLQNMQRVLEPIKVVNPYAPIIDIPKEDFKPRRTLPLLLSFIEAITFYHQYQRKQQVEKTTGELFIQVHPQDVENGFKLMKDVLFRKADELSGAAREFYQFVSDKQRKFTDPKLNNGKGFYARNVREETRIHPRTLNRYLNELSEYGLLQVTGGNKNTTGYSYKLVANRSYEDLQKSIDAQIEKVVKAVWKAYKQSKPKKPSRSGKTIVSH
jgi:DNA-binding HxlR family transcriptional regulator